ncbi:MAG: FG-GAP repeat protein, partial [Ferruginibacter sp.]|nr:FG-GAP repeat protein [Ferruginibacter sp.]
DFNGDGKQDIIIGNSLTSSNTALKSSPYAILSNTGNK